MNKRYLVETTVLGAETMWDFAQAHRIIVRGISKIVPDPIVFRYEIRMPEDLAVLFILTVSPLSCIERKK